MAAIKKILLTLLCFEIAFTAWDTFQGESIFEDFAGAYYTSSTRWHPFLTYTSQKNFDGVLPLYEPGRKYKVTTNSHGFRTREFYPKIPGAYRILVLGDSFIWGYNVDQEDTLARVLERRFQKELSGQVEVLSLGVGSYSGLRYAVLMRLYLDFLDPDMVIVAMDQTDFNEVS